MPNLTPEEVEALQRGERFNALLPALDTKLPIQRALQGSSYPNEESGDGHYDDTSGEWKEYLRYDTDAYNSGKGMAP